MRSTLVALALLVLVHGCRASDNYRRLLPRAEVAADLAYLPGGNPRHALDLFAPRGGGLHPIVLFVHGGYWHGQDRVYARPIVGLYSNVGVALASHGIAAAITSYRLFPETTIEGQVDDVVAALAWVIAHASEHGGDPDRVVLAGHSAGAHLIMTLATQPERLTAAGIDPARVRGYVALSGIYDVPGLMTRADPEIRDGVLVPHFGGRPEAWSPLRAMGPALPPSMFLVGERDYATCLADFERARARLRGTGARARFVALERRTHADLVLEIGGRHDAITPRIARFVEQVTRR